jgi:hypothetical protein
MFATGSVFPINVEAQGRKLQVMTFFRKCCQKALRDAAHEGDLIEATGEITRAGGSLIFLRGMLNCGERQLFTFSGTIKRVKMPMPQGRELI